MRFRTLLLWFSLVATASAGIVDEVRQTLAQNNFSAAESQLNAYRGQQGVTPEYLEAYSWMGRAALQEKQYEQAAVNAKQTDIRVVEHLKVGALDAVPHLPIALGAALEVHSQVLRQYGQRIKAMALLQTVLQTYGNS